MASLYDKWVTILCQPTRNSGFYYKLIFDGKDRGKYRLGFLLGEDEGALQCFQMVNRICIRHMGCNL